MKHAVIILLVLALIPASVTAWGPKAIQGLCEAAVQEAWGVEYLRCLDERTAYCGQLESLKGHEMKQACLTAYAAGVEVTPTNAPEILFQDFPQHMNYDDCPITWLRPSNQFVCDGSGNPAGAEADRWFNQASSVTDKCPQVRAFCTGAFYYAKSRFPLNRVQHLSGCLSGSYEELVEDKIVSGEIGWTVKDQCVFSYMKKMAGLSRKTTQHITFILGEKKYKELEQELIQQAVYVRNPQLRPITTSTFPQTTTTIDGVPMTTTTLATTTSSVKTTTTSTSSTSSTTTLATTTSTTSAPSKKKVQPIKKKPNKDLQEMDELINEMMVDMQENKTEEPQSSGLLMLALTLLIFGASLVILVYVYSNMTRPRIRPKRNLVMPPSVRRRLKKGI